MVDPELPLFQYWLWWSRVLEIASKWAAGERVRLTWRKPTDSLPGMCQGLRAHLKLLWFHLLSIINSKKPKGNYQKVLAIFIAVGGPVTVSVLVCLPHKQIFPQFGRQWVLCHNSSTGPWCLPDGAYWWSPAHHQLFSWVVHSCASDTEPFFGR